MCLEFRKYPLHSPSSGLTTWLHPTIANSAQNQRVDEISGLVRPGTAVVASPLIALMEDQVRNLDQLGVRVGCLNSAMSMQDQRQIEEDLVRGELDLLYVAPERLLMPRMMLLLEQIKVALFAIDEAHCVSQWGHDFRPEYLQLAVLGQRFPGVPRLALTATADHRTRKEIIERRALNQAESFTDSFDRPNIFYRISRNVRPGSSCMLLF